jgi:psp operon transcriptional activator
MTLPVDAKALLREQEASLIHAALEQARYNQRAAAGLLGLNYHQFRAALRRHKLTPRQARPVP